MEASPALWVSCCSATQRSCFNHGNIGTVPPYFQAYETCFLKLIKAPQNLFLAALFSALQVGVFVCVQSKSLPSGFLCFCYICKKLHSPFSEENMCHHCPNSTTVVFVGYSCSLYHCKIIISPVVPKSNCLELVFDILWFYSA